MQKNKILLIIFILLIIIAGGIFYYSKYYHVSVRPVIPKEYYPPAIIEADKYYDFSGHLSKIDLNEKILSAKIDSVTSLLKDISVDYENKTYSFKIDEQTQIQKLTNDGVWQPINLKDLKIGNEIDLFVIKGEIRKQDNFLVSRIVSY